MSTSDITNMNQHSDLNGGCHCGSVRFKTTNDPLDSAICHCRSCQRTSGAESVGWAVFSTSNVRWTGVERTFYVSSEGVERGFCGTCGCTLTYQNVAHTVDIALACLDDPEAVKPAKEIWLDHRITWNALNAELTGHPEFCEEN